jgi:eukaryotic-like serine/threonine-protein kinase
MELLEGQSLRDCIAAKPLEESEVLDFAVQICNALQAAHEKGIVHRDIKTANIS